MNLEIDNSAEPGKPAGAAKPAEPTLEGWKEIATFLKRDVRTVMRWEKNERLPVRRHLHNQRSSVYALPSELKAWQAARAPQPAIPQTVAWWRPRPALGLAAAIFLLMFSFRGGPLAELQAQAQSKPAPTVTEVYSDLSLDMAGSISPDGKRFAGTAWNQGVLTLWDLDSGKSKVLTKYTNWTSYVELPRWSPDGERIAYELCSDSNGCRLEVISASGGDPELSAQPSEAELWDVMDWSRDGKSILCAVRATNGRYSLSIFDVHSRQFRSLLEWSSPLPFMSAQFSPDGKSVAHVTGKPDKPRVGVFSLESGADTLLDSGGASDRAPTWSPDGKQLLFVSDRSGRWDLWSVGVTDGKPASTPALVYADIGDIRRFIGWRDDHTLLYAKRTYNGNFYSAPIDPAKAVVGEAKAPIPFFVGQHREGKWSPDGRKIAFNVPAQGLFLYSPADNKLQQIPIPRMPVWILGWYPSNDAIALWSTAATGAGGVLYRVELTGKLEEIYRANRSYGSVVDLSADGTVLAYTSNVDPTGKSKTYSAICVYDLKRHRMLKQTPAAPDRSFFHPRLTQDSKWVFYFDNPRRTGPGRVMAEPVGPGEPHTVVETEAGTDIAAHVESPDGKYLLYGTRPTSSLSASANGPVETPHMFLVETDGGKPVAVNFPATYQGRFLA